MMALGFAMAAAATAGTVHHADGMEAGSRQADRHRRDPGAGSGREGFYDSLTQPIRGPHKGQR